MQTKAQSPANNQHLLQILCSFSPLGKDEKVWTMVHYHERQLKYIDERQLEYIDARSVNMQMKGMNCLFCYLGILFSESESF
jgi:hypothetical protein